MIGAIDKDIGVPAMKCSDFNELRTCTKAISALREATSAESFTNRTKETLFKHFQPKHECLSTLPHVLLLAEGHIVKMVKYVGFLGKTAIS